jgi:hypothetical protein
MNTQTNEAMTQNTDGENRNLPVRTLLPLTTKFKLGKEITLEQADFLDAYGFLHFEGVATPDEVSAICNERDRIESEWLATGRRSVNGIPVFFGKGENGTRRIQRMPFTSTFSEVIHDFVRDERFEPIRKLVGEDARVGDSEKDGVVINRYENVPGSVYNRLGWHTDGLRDLFYLRMPQQMLNVGIHFDRITAEDGGLRLIPGTHKQGFFKMCFYKPYFIGHRADSMEVVVETNPGDLTIHDGRLWHRVGRSAKVGAESVRRSMYVPYLTGPYEPKDENSKTPLYHYLGKFMRALKLIRS